MTLVFFCLMDESAPQGHGSHRGGRSRHSWNAVHAENMAKLRKTSKFGKWKIKNSEGDYASRTIIQDQSYSFHIHQASFFANDSLLL